MKSSTVRWGVLSTANIGRKMVIPAIQQSVNGEVVAVASRDEAKGASFAAELGIPTFYNNYEMLLADDSIDAVYIPLPNSLHYEWTIRSLEAGKHVLCEKPLGLTAKECLDMEATAERNGRKLMEAFMYRFHPQIEKVIGLVRAGVIGELRLLRASFDFTVTNLLNIRLQPELGGGSLMDVGCYCVNIARTLYREEPETVQAFARWSESGVDETMAGTLRFSNERFAQFDSAFNLPGYQRCQVVGSTGYIEIAAPFRPDDDPGILTLHQDNQEAAEIVTEAVDQYRLMVEHFAECILEGFQPRYDPREAAANMRVIEALYRSARNDGQLERV